MFSLIKSYKRQLLIAVSIMTVLAAALGIFAVRMSQDLFQTRTTTPTISQYVQWSGLWLPQADDVGNFQAYGEGFQDWLIEAKFDLSAEDFKSFVSRNALQRGMPDQLPASSYKRAWFATTRTLERYEERYEELAASANGTAVKHPFKTIWVDPTDPNRPIIYIVAFET